MAKNQLRLKVKGRDVRCEPFEANAIFQWVRGELRCVDTSDARLEAFRLMNADEVKKNMDRRMWTYSWSMEPVPIPVAPKMDFVRFKNLEIQGE